MKLTVLIVDDQEMVRLGLKSMLAGSDITVVADSGDGKQAVELAAKHHPAVAIIDVRMPKHDGFWTLTQMRKRSPKTAVVMLSAFENPNYIAQAVKLGAVDFLNKEVLRHEVIYAIHRAATGSGEPTCKGMRGVKIAMAKRKNRKDDTPLTNRELEVLTLITDGRSNREIAKELDISLETVKEHVQHMLRRLKFESRTQAALWALREGIVS